jgi:hypothetical protein
MKSYKGSDFLIGWSVGTYAGWVWAKGGVGFGQVSRWLWEIFALEKVEV